MTHNVKDTKGIAAEGVAAKLPDSAPPARAKADKVSVDNSREAQAKIAALRANAASNRGARLAEVAAQVRQGHYEPNPQRIADRILQAAELDASIRAALSH